MNNFNKQNHYPLRNGTETSAFGSPGRIGHDSSKFYSGKLYQGFDDKKNTNYIENEIAPSILNKIFCKSSEFMEELPDNSVHLMVTSPPYNVGKEYDKDLTLDEYRDLIKRVLTQVYRVLVPGGRACINLANLGRKPYIPLHSYIISDSLEIGFLMRGEIIWNKASSASPSTAWGSWRSPSNPTLRDIHEYVLVFCKDTFSRKPTKNRISTISREEFLEYTKSVWTFPAESARKIGHPAPFPIELPYRFIQLYTFEHDVVLDPFLGSGATCIAALKTNRLFVGYDIKEEYVRLAQKRIDGYKYLTENRQPVLIEENKPKYVGVKMAIEKPLWNVDYEKSILTDTMFATIYCNTEKGGCGHIEKAIFRGDSTKCPVCGKNTLSVNTNNKRNAVVGDITERFALKIFEDAIKNSKLLDGKFFVKRHVISPKLELKGKTAADLAILNRNIDGPVPVEAIKCIFEVKMSVVWNWKSDDRTIPIADYDTHAGRPSIYRTDSILKAIGKAAITRSCLGSEKIPFVVIGNTPPPPNYRDKVDGTVRAGLIQKWISLTSNPLSVNANSSLKRNPKETLGFLRIDNIAELQEFLNTILTKDWQYFGAMVEAQKVGEIIKSLDLSKKDEDVGYDFLKLLQIRND